MYHSQSMSDKEIVFDITEMIVKETKRIEKKGAVDFRCRPCFPQEGWEPLFPAGVKCLPLQSTKGVNHFSKSNKLYEKSLNHTTSPPRYCGGSIDCKELVRGSILFPISVDGALFSIGDGHRTGRWGGFRNGY